MFCIRILVFIVYNLHLYHRLSPQGSDLSKPFPKSTLAHTATVLSYNMALIITSIKPINPSYFTIVCAHPGLLLVSFINVMFHLGTCFHWIIYVSLHFYQCISYWLTYWSIQLQSWRVFNKLTYLLAYIYVQQWRFHSCHQQTAASGSDNSYRPH